MLDATSGSRLQAEISQCLLAEVCSHRAEQRSPVQSGIASMSNSGPPAASRPSGRCMLGCRNLQYMRQTQSSLSRSRPKSAPPRGHSHHSSHASSAFTMLQNTQHERSARHRPFARVNGDQDDLLDAYADSFPSGSTMRTLRLTEEEQAALYARNMRWRQKVERRLESLRQEQRDTEVSECTFRPRMQARSSLYLQVMK